MSDNVGFVYLLPTYQAVPACALAIFGECTKDGRCPCQDHRPPEGRRGIGLPQTAIDAFWEQQAMFHPPAATRWLEAWV